MVINAKRNSYLCQIIHFKITRLMWHLLKCYLLWYNTYILFSQTLNRNHNLLSWVELVTDRCEHAEFNVLPNNKHSFTKTTDVKQCSLNEYHCRPTLFEITSKQTLFISFMSVTVMQYIYHSQGLKLCAQTPPHTLQHTLMTTIMVWGWCMLQQGKVGGNSRLSGISLTCKARCSNNRIYISI